MKKPVWNNNILVLGLFLCFLAVAPVRSSAAFSGRIVSLAPSVTECLFSLGSGDLVAGVTDHDVFPEEVKELPSVGGYFDPSLEKILSLSPDLVIGISTFHGRLLERLESMGVKTLPLTVHRGLEGVGDSLHSIGEKIGKRAMA